ncbi:MAG: carbon monoxide dehydrogenase subunit G [Bacteroidota bacterium]
MHLEGTHLLKAPVQVIYDMLMDPEILARITPGISRLEPTAEDTFDAHSSVKIGPVKGVFKGTVQITNKQPPNGFVLLINQKSKIGNVAAEGSIQLNPKEAAETEVVFSGDAKLSGTLARTGQRVLSGVARTLTNQFFSDLETEIDAIMASQPQPVPKPDGLWARFTAWLKRLFG